MEEIDLTDIISARSNAIEIEASIEPRHGEIEILRDQDDPYPVTMHHGARTIIGAPESRRLYVRLGPSARACRVTVVDWYD